jgi:subtilisin-like proprotein convertase family protein
MSTFRRALAALALTPLPLAACADAPSGPVVEPPVADGKSDIADRVDLRGTLSFGADGAVTGSFAEDLQFDAWTFETGADAVVTLGITRSGTARNLDTTLFLFGPRANGGGFGTTAIAFDDDSGWSRHSRIASFRLPSAGTWMAVVGTRDGRGRGQYRLELACNSNDCKPPVVVEPTTGCHPAFADAINACIDDSIANAENPWAMVLDDHVDVCADAEVVAPARDALCNGPDAPSDLCAASWETLQNVHLPLCAAEILDTRLDGACVFGNIYGDLFRRAEAVVVIDRAVLTAADTLDTATTAQVLAAVRASAFDDALELAEVFDFVDGGEINRLDLWDASQRRPFTAYEFGAGDNSFGMIFEAGSATRVATINDGDFYDCTALWGDERRRCTTDADCAEGLKCNGRGPEVNIGRCVLPGADTQAAIGTSCTSHEACGTASGLLCAGVEASGAGLCLPAWMRSRFYTEPGMPIPDNDPNGSTVELQAFGLATVAMDTRLTLLVSHPRISDLRVTLQGGEGTEAVIFAGEREGTELWLDDAVVRGLPGDESVNVPWRLKVVDTKGGAIGTIYRFGLEITSRWD